MISQQYHSHSCCAAKNGRAIKRYIVMFLRIFVALQLQNDYHLGDKEKDLIHGT